MYPLDPVIAAGMIFSIICLILVGGFIVLFPITRRLGEALQVWIEQQTDPERGGELGEIHYSLRALSGRLETLERKYAFVEELVAGEAEGEGRPALDKARTEEAGAEG